MTRRLDDLTGPPPPFDGTDPEPFAGFPQRTSEQIYDSPWCGLRRDHIELADGKLQEYHVFEVSDAIVVVPVLPDGSVLMLWQYRYPHGKTHWEVPAGRVHGGESAEDAAARELREETGYRAGAIERVSGFYPTNGISPHFAHVLIATGCTYEGPVELDPAERLERRIFSRDQAWELLRSGTMEDGFTALALFYALTRDF